MTILVKCGVAFFKVSRYFLAILSWFLRILFSLKIAINSGLYD